MNSNTSKIPLLLRAAILVITTSLGLTGCMTTDDNRFLNPFSDARLSSDVGLMIDDANFSGQPSQNSNTNNDVKS